MIRCTDYNSSSHLFITYVLSAGAKDNNTPLHVAVDSGRVAIVQMLLDANADVHVSAKVSTAVCIMINYSLYSSVIHAMSVDDLSSVTFPIRLHLHH